MCLAARLSRRVGGVPRALGCPFVSQGGCCWSAGCEGLQPGEKLDEELFLPTERPRKTELESLWVADAADVSLPPGAIELLEHAAAHGDGAAVRQALQEIVPEYRPVHHDIPKEAWERAGKDPETSRWSIR